MRFYMRMTGFTCLVITCTKLLFLASIHLKNPRRFSYNLEQSISGIWENRVKYLRRKCSYNRMYGIHGNQTKSYFIHAPKHNLTLCKVPKSGSTLLSVVVLTLENGYYNDLFNLRRSVIHSMILRKTEKLTGPPESPFRTKNVIVSRDPYKRLYSAFVDRCFLLRTSWEVPGLIEAIHKGDYMTEVGKCGYIVHFHDFVDKVTTDGLKGYRIDPHYCPIYTMCRICDVDYHVVMQQETLTRDTEHILQQFNISNTMRTSLMEQIRGSSTEKMLEGLIDELIVVNNKMRWMKEHCNSTIAFTVRIWEAFKLQGYIRPNRQFPYIKFQEYENIDVKSIIGFFLEEIRTNPLSHTERSLQRSQSLIDAYKDMPKRIVANIQLMYKMDFLMFGYDINPPS